MSDIAIVRRGAFKAVVVGRTPKGRQWLLRYTDGLDQTCIEIDLVEELAKTMAEHGLDVDW